jgi:hypothetical protein
MIKLALTLALLATPAAAQVPTETKALTNIMIAHIYCDLPAPPGLAGNMLEVSAHKLDVDMKTAAIASKVAAQHIIEYMRSGTYNPKFCESMADVYRKAGDAN